MSPLSSPIPARHELLRYGRKAGGAENIKFSKLRPARSIISPAYSLDVVLSGSYPEVLELLPTLFILIAIRVLR